MKFIFCLALGGCMMHSSLQAKNETSKGQIIARGCTIVAEQKNNGEKISFTALFGSKQYKIGEGLELFVTAQKDSYVTIIDKGSDPEGERSKILFENELLIANQEKIFPPKGYKLAVKPPIGSNTFEIQLTRKPTNANQSDDSDSSRDVDLEKLPETKEEPTRCMISFQIVE